MKIKEFLMFSGISLASLIYGCRDVDSKDLETTLDKQEVPNITYSSPRKELFKDDFKVSPLPKINGESTVTFSLIPLADFDTLQVDFTTDYYNLKIKDSEKKHYTIDGVIEGHTQTFTVPAQVNVEAQKPLYFTFQVKYVDTGPSVIVGRVIGVPITKPNYPNISSLNIPYNENIEIFSLYLYAPSSTETIPDSLLVSRIPTKYHY